MGSYIPVKSKFLFTVLVAVAWASFSIWAAQPWYQELASHIGTPLAVFIITFIAIVPGFINAFVVSSLLFDHRPPLKVVDQYPDVTVMVPAFNEETGIHETVESILRWHKFRRNLVYR
jgi:biofilm PGA synthesis N-glycosyltransferase PgaC